MSDRRIEHDIFGTVPRKRTINQKQKGNTNERVAAKFLSSWTKAQFNRTPSSGGMHLKNQLFCGDLVCITEDFFFPFVVETKHLKSLHVTEELRANSKIFTIYRQAQRDADRIGKRPLCLIRGNGMDAGQYYLILSRDLSLKLVGRGGVAGAKPLAWGSAPDGVQVGVWLAKELQDSYTWNRFVTLLGLTGAKKR